jgi:hypothetical protein
MAWRLRSLILPLLVLAGCVPREPPEPLPPPPLPAPQVLHEEEIKPIERPELVILDIEEVREGKRITLTGTIINRGTGPARDLQVTVRVVDVQGATLLTTAAVPGTTRLAAGATTAFTARFERPENADEYRVEAVSR